jgi:hypothetical protein
MKIMKLSDIKIKENFAKTVPSEVKMNECRKIWNKYNTQDRYIVVNRSGYLIDGYVQYLVLKENGIEEAMTYTSEYRRRYLKRIPKMSNSADYRNKETMYIYGHHPNDYHPRQYMWYVPEKWESFKNKIAIGDVVYGYTKFGSAPVIVDRIQVLNSCPVDIEVKRIASKSIRKVRTE